MVKIRDAALPYALFFVGLFIGWTDIALTLVGVPLHEIGHVVGALLTGGWGVWDFTQWNAAHIRGGNPVVVSFAGEFFHQAAATGIAAVLIYFRRATWFGGILMGTATTAIMTHHGLTDWDAFPRYAHDMTRAIDILKWIYLAIIVLAFVLSIARLIAESKRA